MDLFGRKAKARVEHLERENKMLKHRNKQLVDRCNKKDEFYLASISDALRHGSSRAGKEMADRKKYLNGK